MPAIISHTTKCDLTAWLRSRCGAGREPRGHNRAPGRQVRILRWLLLAQWPLLPQRLGVVGSHLEGGAGQSALRMVNGDTVVQERTIRRDRSCWVRSYNLK
jgi:hypothetical protein